MNILLFSALAWFFYNVLPSEKSGPFYFIFTRDYWARLFPKRNYSTPNVQPVIRIFQKISIQKNRKKYQNSIHIFPEFF